MVNELLYCGIDNRTPCSNASFLVHFSVFYGFICVTIFSGTVQARILKLGIHMDNELLYCGIDNRTPCSYSSFFVHISGFYGLICVTAFSGTVQARVFKYGIHM